MRIHKDADLAAYLKPVLHKDGSYFLSNCFYRSRKNISHLSMRYADGSERKVAMEKVEQMKRSEDILTEKSCKVFLICILQNDISQSQ